MFHSRKILGVMDVDFVVDDCSQRRYFNNFWINNLLTTAFEKVCAIDLHGELFDERRFGWTDSAVMQMVSSKALSLPKLSK